MQTGEELQTLEGHESVVNCVAWSPDSRLVASAGGWRDKGVRVGDVVGGTQATQLLNTDGVRSVAWGSSNASLLVSSCYICMYVCVYVHTHTAYLGGGLPDLKIALK